MKALLIILLSLSYSTYAKAGFETDYSEIKEVILTLGLDLKDFSTIFPRHCNSQTPSKTPKQSYIEHKFLRDAVDNGFFSAAEGGEFLFIDIGLKCKALNEYYFNNKYSNLISKFIKKDKLIIKKYGFSSIDLFKYPFNFQGNYIASHQIPGHKELILKQIKRFKNQNVFNVVETIKNTVYKKIDGEFIEVKGAPYSTFRVTPTEKFIYAHKTLREINNEEP